MSLNGAELASAELAGDSSGGITGTPLALPPRWRLMNGYLLGQEVKVEGAQLPDAELAGVDLGGADLARTNLQGADLNGANLRYADAEEADLQDADLAGGNLERDNLGGANLAGTNLQRQPGIRLSGTREPHRCSTRKR